MILQNLYILVLNPVYKLIDRIDMKKKNFLLGACLFIMSLQFFFYTTWEKYEISFGFTELFLINTFLLVLAGLFSMDRPLEKIRWNRWISVPWFLCCILMILTGFHHNITPALMFFAAVMLFVFPCFYFIWNNRGDYGVLYRILSKAMAAALAVFYIVNMLIVPYEAPYYGIAVNPNSIGLASVAGAIVSLHLINTEKKRWAYVLLLGASIAFTLLSGSRASLIAIFLAACVFVIGYFRSRGERAETVAKALAVMVCILAVTAVSIVGYKCVLEKVTPVTNEYFASQAYAETKTDDTLSSKLNREGNLNTLSSSRLVIWQTYLSEMNMIGHERGDKGLYIPYTGKYQSAHNTYIELGYRCGLPVGLLYAWIAVFAAVYAFRFVFGKKLFNWQHLMIPMSVMAFGVLSNLERAIYPLEKAHIFLFFMALAPMFMTMKANEKKEIHGE